MTICTAPSTTIRALFLDIDGTLIGSAEQVSPRVQRALAAAHHRGCEVVLCTGRTRYRTLPIARLLGIPLGYAVTSNGGVLAHFGTSEIIYRHLIPKDIALTVINAVVTAGSEPYVYEDSDIEGIDGARVLYHPDLPIGAWAAADPRYRPHASLLMDLPFRPVSVSAYGPPEKMRPMARELAQRLSNDLSVIQSGTQFNWGVEVYVGGISKRAGLETMAVRLDVAQEEIMAIGDHFNDLDMIQWAGWGVAMGNALPEAKAVADWVTGSVDEDGAAQAIERFIL